MKRLNITNKIYAVILLALIIITTVKFLRYKGWNRYYYGASFTAPSTYPVNVSNGYFILADDDIGPIASGEVNHGSTQWGYGEFQSPNTKEHLPVKLVLSYSSYRDKAFYTDTVLLPQQAIKNAFEMVNEKGINTEHYSTPTVKRFDFVIGIANKGNIIVWLQGEKHEITLLKHRITRHKPVGDDTYNNDSKLPKEKYFEEMFNIDSTEKVNFAKGVDKEANYIDTPSLFKKIMQ